MRDVKAAMRNLRLGAAGRDVERAYLAGVRAGREEAEVLGLFGDEGPSRETIRELGEWLRAPFNPEEALRATGGPRRRRK